jgi:oligopeptide/dipeptide ABC transporter ATP-binding protein
MSAAPILRAQGLSKTFPGRRGGADVRAVDDVSLEVAPGETLGVVGESGCGKSTLARLLLRLIDPSDGRVEFDGTDITTLDRRALRPVRRRIQAVFQDPYASLNSRETIARILREPFDVHGITPPNGVRERSAELLRQVGLDAAVLSRRPGELSGGQLQRVAIARALTTDPALIVADEPTSALDVSIQAQILNLLAEVRERTGVALVVISHNVQVIRHISDRVAVMYLGRVAELGAARDLTDDPLHPYTQALLRAVPHVDPARRKRVRSAAGDEPPDPTHVPSGCPFHPRCPAATEVCRTTVPAWRELEPARWVACHHAPAATRAPERTTSSGGAV